MPDQIIHTPEDTSSFKTPVDKMIGEVAGLIGADEDPTLHVKALEYLNRAADRMNAKGVYFYRLKTKEYTSFTEGQETLALPTDWGWPEGRPVVYESTRNDAMWGHLEWVSYSTYLAHRESDDTTSTSGRGRPQFIALKSEADDVAYIYPRIESGSRNQPSKIVIPYFGRVQRPGEAGATLFLTPEMREAMVTMAEALIMRYRFSGQPQIWRPYMQDAERAIQEAKGAARRRQGAMQYWGRVAVSHLIDGTNPGGYVTWRPDAS
jgi:hypothetical protein